MGSPTRPMTNSRSSAGFWLAMIFIWWVALFCPPAHSDEQPQQPQRQCLVDTSPVGSQNFFLPCSKVEPSVYPMVWYWEGQDV